MSESALHELWHQSKYMHLHQYHNYHQMKNVHQHQHQRKDQHLLSIGAHANPSAGTATIVDDSIRAQIGASPGSCGRRLGSRGGKTTSTLAHVCPRAYPVTSSTSRPVLSFGFSSSFGLSENVGQNTRVRPYLLWQSGAPSVYSRSLPDVCHCVYPLRTAIPPIF